MYLEVYVDVIFIINFIMDFVLLFAVKKILRYANSALRLCLGAVAGAVGACLFAVTPGINRPLRFFLAYILLSYLMIVISFSRRSFREQVKAVVLLYISTFFLGGLLNSLYYYTDFGFYLMNKHSRLYLLAAFLAGGMGLIIFVRLLRKLRMKESEYYQTELILNGRTVRAVGFMDTGNRLRDPYFGKPVIVTEYTVIEPLLTNSQNTMLRKLLDDFENGRASYDALKREGHSGNSPESISGNISEASQGMPKGIPQEELLPVRLIPFHSVGKSGILPAFELEKVILWEEGEETVREKVLTAISREKLSVRKDYQIILHKEVM